MPALSPLSSLSVRSFLFVCFFFFVSASRVFRHQLECAAVKKGREEKPCKKKQQNAKKKLRKRLRKKEPIQGFFFLVVFVSNEKIYIT